MAIDTKDSDVLEIPLLTTEVMTLGREVATYGPRRRQWFKRGEKESLTRGTIFRLETMIPQSCSPHLTPLLLDGIVFISKLVVDWSLATM